MSRPSPVIVRKASGPLKPHVQRRAHPNALTTLSFAAEDEEGVPGWQVLVLFWTVALGGAISAIAAGIAFN